MTRGKGNTVVIYHGNCMDGFASAWVVREAVKRGKLVVEGEVEYIPGFYGKPPVDKYAMAGKKVIMVDFSYKKEQTLELADLAHSVLILDHHKSAEKELTGVYTKNIYPYFRMDKSGVGMCWDYFFPDESMPKILQYVQDRDLWLFKLEGTKEIVADIFSHPYDFAWYDNFIAGGEGQLDRHYRDGVAILRKQAKDLNELLAVTVREFNIAGHLVPVANLPYTLASDAGEIMAKGKPFAVTYYDANYGRVFSLRSAADGVDVSEVATKFGGGGHRTAAGFVVPDWDEFDDGTWQSLAGSLDDHSVED